MLGAAIVIGAILIYALVLIAIAVRADKTSGRPLSERSRGALYGLSLATACSSWTYFGAVGEARSGSWLYFASGLGPILGVTLGFPLWRRIAVITKQENVGSIADFLAARYGKNRTLGSLVAVVSAVGALPYLALQIFMLCKVWNFTTGIRAPSAFEALILVAMLVVYTLAFGTRRPSLTQRSRGIVGMVAFESCVKLLGLVAVAALCVRLATVSPMSITTLLQSVPPLRSGTGPAFFGAMILSTLTAFTLPRQFHLGFVTLERPTDVKAARWIVPFYFSAWPVAVLMIGTGARAGLGPSLVPGDLQVLAIPLTHGAPLVALLALLGGLSAGSAMFVVETTAVSGMVSNELVLPWLTPRRWRAFSGKAAGDAILRVRRLTTIILGCLAWLYFVGVENGIDLTHLGFTALAAFAQLFPALVGAVYWRRGHARGAIAGISVGTAVWALLIVVPTFLTDLDPWHEPAAKSLWLQSAGLSFQIAAFTSLAINALLYVLVSLRTTPALIDTIQANSFVDRSLADRERPSLPLGTSVGDLRTLLTQFVGPQEADRALRSHFGSSRESESDDVAIDPALARAAERTLAGVVGAPSARNLLAIALAEGSQDAAEISRILDEAAHAVQFGRDLLQGILDTLDQAVSVIDAELRLVAWNSNYLELMGLRVEEAQVGSPVAEIFAAAGSSGGAQAVRRFSSDRIQSVARRERFRGEIAILGGRALRCTGTPLGNSDYLLTFVDITDLRSAERVLARSNEELEARVRSRTAELTSANSALAEANEYARVVGSSQQRFVAAASHDLVQPLHAARLFIGSALAGPDLPADRRVPLQRADQSVEGAHRLLKALLQLSQMEVGALQPKFEPVDVELLLMSLFEEFSAQAEGRGLELVALPTRRWVLSDKDLLRSMLQNLIVNAIRYTPAGRVVVACRGAGEIVRLEVRDSGVGMSEGAVPRAFMEYERLPAGEAMAEGAGLGLSIVRRIATMLGHPVSIRTRPGAGSVFSISVPRAEPEARTAGSPSGPIKLEGLRVLCVDDEQEILAGMTALLERWGASVTAAASADGIDAEKGRWDVAIVDLRLGEASGLDLLRQLRGSVATRYLVTATQRSDLDASPEIEGIECFEKPIDPAALLGALSGLVPAGAASARSRASSEG